MILFEVANTTNFSIDEQAILAGIERAEKKLRQIHNPRHVGVKDDPPSPPTSLKLRGSRRLRKDRQPDRFVAIEVVTKSEIQKLNQTLRGKNEATDIISISSQETEAGEQVIKTSPGGELSFELTQTKPVNPLPALGQLIVCWEVIQQKALESGQSPTRELEWVVEHGIYHLMGFHHAHD